jgi:hypothetical protein
MQFRAQEIQSEFGVGYAVTVADVNGDKRLDVVAINPTQVVWFENPSWQRHVILDGATEKDNVCIAAQDIDGDGKVDFALGAAWKPTNTSAGGSLQWIGRNNADPEGMWKLTQITSEPTLHRIRWGDIDGDGKPELIVVPLHGRGTKGPEWEGQGARILVFHVPARPALETWPAEVADDSLHIVHNFLVTNFDRAKDHEILTASREGIHVLKRKPDGSWSKTFVAPGAPGEIKLGKARSARVIATVEPWHGNSVVVYREENGTWNRQVIEDQLAGGHALGWADFDGDGDDELAVGWREKNFGLAVYKIDPAGRWNRAAMVDGGGMATEDLVIADLNGDKRPDIIAAGRATRNVKIYWNETRQ